jgi:hypothetical protein
MCLEESVGSRLPLNLTSSRADIDVPDTERHRALLEGLALNVES